MINIIEQFSQYLNRQNISSSSLNNYRSDLYDFEKYLKDKISELGTYPKSLNEALPFLDSYLAGSYKRYLKEKNLPIVTINRRLSVIRTFGRFLNLHGYVDTDISKDLINYPVPQTLNEKIYNSYLSYLDKSAFLPNTRKNYLADIRSFAVWANKTLPDLDLNKYRHEEIKRYLNDTNTSDSSSTGKRKLSAIKNFFTWLGQTDNESNPVGQYLITIGRIQNSIESTKLSPASRLVKTIRLFFATRPNQSFAGKMLLVGITAFLFTLMSFKVNRSNSKSLSDKTAPVSVAAGHNNLKEILFEGNLVTDDGLLINTPATVAFRLYDSSQADPAENALWESGSCTVFPDDNGNFSTTLGFDCGHPIDGNIFNRNQEIYLGMSVENEPETALRIPIAAVGRAETANRLNGFLPNQVASSNTIPVLNEEGELTLGADMPKIKSVGNLANLVLEGQGGVTLTAADQTNSSIYVNPDGNGSFNLFFEGDSPQGNGFINAFGANLTSGALYAGQVASDAIGYNLIDLRSGYLAQQRFTVDALGNTQIAGTLTVKSAYPSAYLAPLAITQSGTITTMASDIRLKENIAPISQALETVKKLHGVTFTWKNDPKAAKKIGMIAQEVSEIAPELTYTDPVSGYQGIYYQETVALVIEAVKEMTTRLQTGLLDANRIITNGFYSAQAEIGELLVTAGLSSPKLAVGLISPLADDKQIIISLPNGSGSASGSLIISDDSGREVTRFDAAGNADFAGEITARSVRAEEIKAGNIDEIEKILKEIQENQILTAESRDWLKTDPALSSERILATDLFVTGQTAVASLWSQESLSVGTDFMINSVPDSNGKLTTTLNTTNRPLAIQSLAMAPLEIMNGLFVIDTDGSVRIAGNLTVGGKITAYDINLASRNADPANKVLAITDGSNRETASLDSSGKAVFNEIATNRLIIAADNQETNGQESGEITTNAAAGTGVLPAGFSETTINNTQVNQQTLIMVSPVSSTNNNVLFVKAKTEGLFKVGLMSAIDTPVEFNWWIIQRIIPTPKDIDIDPVTGLNGNDGTDN